jgi:hypothetical protein
LRPRPPNEGDRRRRPSDLPGGPQAGRRARAPGAVAAAAPTRSPVALVLQADGKIVLASAANEANEWNFAAVRFDVDPPLLAASLPQHASPARITSKQVQPLLGEAMSRWQAAGAGASVLDAIDVGIADLGGTTLGLAAGNTIWLDDNAAGWGWFVDPTPSDDSEFTTPGNQGEHDRMDLLTVLTHEIGHLLGYEHEVSGGMQETLTAGTRLTPSAGSVADWLAAVDVLFAETWSNKQI